MRIHHTQRTISTVTATTEAPGFAADNITRREIRRAWRSTSGAAQTVTINLGSSQYVEALWLQEINFTSATVGGNPMTIALEPNGRRKGFITIGATVSSIAVSIPSGSPTEGYWSIGSAFVFSSVYAMPISPRYDFEHPTEYPGVRRKLPNGRPVVAYTGPFFTRITGDFWHLVTEDVAAIVRLARDSGIIGVDMELAEAPWKAWPCEFVEEEMGASIPNAALDETAFDLVEVV